MRVLMVSDVYFPRVNGVSTSIETFRRTLGAQGIEVRLVVPRYRDEPDEEGIVRVPGWPVPGDPEDRLPRWPAMHRAVRAAAADCQLIHIQTPFMAHYAGLRAARSLGLPVLATYHTLFEEYIEHYAPLLPADWLKKLARKLSQRQCNQLDAVIVPSRAMQQRLSEYGVETPIEVLPTGIPVERFQGGDRAGFRARHGIAAERPVALFVGRVAHEKNIGFLLEALPHALQRCPQLLLLIAGEGPALHELQASVARLGLTSAVQFIGYLDRQHELPACYAAADVFAFASRTETQGLVLLEAMAAGLPVVALAEMGTIDILAPGQGALSPPANPARFGAALGHLLAHPQTRQRLSIEAAWHAQEWSDHAMASRLAQLYRTLIGQTASSAQANPIVP